MTKAKPDSSSMLNRIGRQDQSYNHDIALSTNILRPFERQQKQKMIDTDAEKEVYTQSRIRKNWFHPHI